MHHIHVAVTPGAQLFINFKDNSAMLNPQGFAAFGEVTSGMDVVDKIIRGDVIKSIVIK